MTTVKNFRTVCKIHYTQTLARMNINHSTYYRFTYEEKPKNRQGKNCYAILETEKQKVIAYAKQNGFYFHRELTYRLMDENIACLSITSVYTILKQANLIENKGKTKTLLPVYDAHQRPDGPDRKWQSDITYIYYKNRYYFLITFLDVYSRFITHHKLLTDMTSDTVSRVFEEYLQTAQLLSKPSLQTDHGSCYKGSEFQLMLTQYGIEHHFIHPHCPNENAEIERSHRTIKEGLEEQESPETFEELEHIIQEVIEYYNMKRYHKSLGYVPPIEYYRGNPETIFQERRRKLAEARTMRKKFNSLS